VSIGDGGVRTAASRVVDHSPRRGSVRMTEIMLLDQPLVADARDERADLDPLAARLAEDPTTLLYRICASTSRNFSLVRSGTERLAGGRGPAAVGNIRTRFCYANPVVLDVLITEDEVLIALPDRRGHPYHRACVVVDDPDFAAAAREWYDESVWDAPVELVDIRYEHLRESLDAAEARFPGHHSHSGERAMGTVPSDGPQSRTH
jgi:hypothetical protein